MLTNKLKSNTGASITIALLLFLVCTVVGAVVLTAATAAAGRVSQLAETDQRYFSVTSAAELLEKELNGKSVTIRQETEEKTEIVYVDQYADAEDEDGNVVSVLVGVVAVPQDPTYTYKAYIADGDQKTLITSTSADFSSGADFLAAEACYLMFGTDTDLSDADNEEIVQCSFDSGNERRDVEFTFSAADKNSQAIDSLTIGGTVSMLADGTLVFLLTNNEAGADKHFRMKLTMIPSITESTEDLTVETETLITATSAKISTIKWTVGSIEKVESA